MSPKIFNAVHDLRRAVIQTWYRWVERANSTVSHIYGVQIDQLSVRVLLRGRERLEPEEHHRHEGPLLPLLHPAVRPRPQADRPRVLPKASVQGQPHPGHRQG